MDDWRGYLIGGFALVWIANIYMSLFALLRQAIKAEKTKIDLEETILKDRKQSATAPPSLVPGKRSILRRKDGSVKLRDL